MSVSKRIFTIIALLMLTPFVVGAFLSREWEATGQTTLQGDPERVFQWLTSARHWHEWNQAAEPSPVPFGVEFAGPESGVGSKLFWSHDQFGSGELEVIEIDPGERIRVKITSGQGEPIFSEVTIERSPPEIFRRDWSTFSGLGPLDGYVAWMASLSGRARIKRGLQSLEERAKAMESPAPESPAPDTAPTPSSPR